MRTHHRISAAVVVAVLAVLGTQPSAAQAVTTSSTVTQSDVSQNPRQVDGWLCHIFNLCNI